MFLLRFQTGQAFPRVTHFEPTLKGLHRVLDPGLIGTNKCKLIKFITNLNSIYL